MGRNIAISDIHGHLKTFRKLLEEEVVITTPDSLFLLGDIIDGPNSAGVIDYIINLQEKGFKITTVMGNHEHMLLKEVENGRRNLHQKYLTFLKNMEHYIEIENYVLVHAGFNLSLDFPPDDVNAMFWEYSWNHTGTNKWLGKRIVIHGHTVKYKPEIIRSAGRKELKMGIDNGVFISGEDGKGSLCALDFSSWKLYFQENIDKT